MCGLVGAYGCQIDIAAGLAKIAHRGPDAQTFAALPNATLGHSRLSIQDCSAAAGQPYRLGSVTLTYNGEVWNGAALRTYLSGHTFRTTGDTEIVAALLDQDGWRGLDRIAGQFALAWQDRFGTWLARDRFGEVPLYAWQDPAGGWQWASELKALPLGAQAVSIKPGHALHLQTGQSSPWAIERPAQEATAETVRGLLRAGVAERLVGDARVCFLLSGGLDSSLILALARDLGIDPVAYTAVLDPDSPDLAAARQVARELQVTLVEVPIPAPTLDSITEAVRTVEIPMKAQVEIALANLPLARAIASDGYRVALSGEAADELFGGYGNMQIAASGCSTDAEYEVIKRAALAKMARGNFARVNKVFMAAGVEARLPFMQRALVELAMGATREQSPPGKGLLKAAAAGLVPDNIIKRPKLTFQGATGTATAASLLVDSPVKHYNAIARQEFGWLPRDSRKPLQQNVIDPEVPATMPGQMDLFEELTA